MNINIIMTVLTNRQRINIYTQLICYLKVHINIHVYSPPPQQSMDIELHVCVFYELFLDYLHGHHKIFSSTFRCLFYIFIKTGRQTYIVHETSTSARYVCSQVNSYTYNKPDGLLCNIEFFFSTAKTCLTGFNLQRHLNELKKRVI